MEELILLLTLPKKGKWYLWAFRLCALEVEIFSCRHEYLKECFKSQILLLLLPLIFLPKNCISFSPEDIGYPRKSKPRESSIIRAKGLEPGTRWNRNPLGLI